MIGCSCCEAGVVVGSRLLEFWFSSQVIGEAVTFFHPFWGVEEMDC